jgi:hypothetical protein
VTIVPPEGGAQPAVSPQQQAVDFARRVVAEFRSTGTYSGPQAQLALRPLFDVNEVRIARARFRHFTFTGIGDGTAQNTGLLAAGALASGSPAAMIGGVAGMMIGKARAKNAAIPKWHELPPGELVITDHGVYMLKPGDSPTILGWNNLLGATLTAWDSLEIDHEEGKDSIVTPAATTIFGLWSLAVFPQHPQLQTLLQG